MHDTLKREMTNSELVIKDIKELAHQLYLNVSYDWTVVNTQVAGKHYS